MEKNQFRFSFIVGVVFIAMGSFISMLAPIGIPLGMLGVAIVVLSVLTRIMADKNQQQPELVPVKINREEIRQQ